MKSRDSRGKAAAAAKSFVVLHFLFKFFGNVDYIKEYFFSLLADDKFMACLL